MSSATVDPEVEDGEDTDETDNRGNGGAKQSKAPPQHARRHNVVLHNDEHHTYKYVTRMLQEVCGQTKEAAFQLTEEINEQGKAIVYTNHLELAELKKDQITSYGKDHEIPECKGSMTATLETC
jgi:ATP-dependent Clp protease adaptor protein ClpS